MRISQFTAFYPSRPFWAADKIDFSDPKALDAFDELMTEEVYQESNEMFSLKICRDGMIMLRVEALEREDVGSSAPGNVEADVKIWGEYLDYLNSFYLLLDSSTLRLMNLAYFNLHEITSRDAFRVRYQSGKIGGYAIAIESVASGFQMGRFKSSYARIPIQNDPRIMMRQVISSEALANAVNQFRFIVEKPGIEKVLASFTKSISEYKVGNYETSVVLAWFISEGVIHKMWMDRITALNRDVGGGQQRINRERKEHLTGRDFPVSVVASILELCGLLPFNLFKDVNTVRGFRNKIVHGDPTYSPKAIEAQLAITTALELFRTSYQVDFTPNLSYSVSGL